MKITLVIASLGAGLLTLPSAASACPAAIPSPATATDVECFTLAKPVNTRCATALSPTVCSFLNNKALTENLVTPDGYNYLVATGFCAMVGNFGVGDQIYDFCPQGCFAAETRVLTGLSLDGRASYARAQSVLPSTTLMGVSDGASLDAVVMAPQTVKRTVAGPEDAELYVFALGNGATLRVTQHHPMVLASGKVIEAREVDARMTFVGFDGQPVAIASIAREKPTADVFNFETAGDSPLNHLIVAEGILVGDLKLQNQLADEDGSIGLRR